MTEYNGWGEPVPEQLTDPAQARAWNRLLVANEWFDGEDGIAHGAQQAMLADWNRRQPTIIEMYQYSTGKSEKRARGSRREAEAYADIIERTYGDSVFIRVYRKPEQRRG